MLAQKQDATMPLLKATGLGTELRQGFLFFVLVICINIHNDNGSIRRSSNTTTTRTRTATTTTIITTTTSQQPKTQRTSRSPILKRVGGTSFSTSFVGLSLSSGISELCFLQAPTMPPAPASPSLFVAQEAPKHRVTLIENKHPGYNMAILCSSLPQAGPTLPHDR
jgi:hypothetical protein